MQLTFLPFGVCYGKIMIVWCFTDYVTRPAVASIPSLKSRNCGAPAAPAYFLSCGIASGAPAEVIVALCVWWCKRWLLRPAWRWWNRFLTDSSIYSTDIAVILCDQLFYAELFDLSNVEPADLQISGGSNCICCELIRQWSFLGRECAVARVSSFDSERSKHLLIGRECALARVSLFDNEYWYERESAVVRWVVFFCQ